MVIGNPMMAETLERITAFLWVGTALFGVALRIRRLRVLVTLVYTDPKDQEYLKTVIRSSWLRGTVNVILVVGGTLAIWLDPTVPLGDVGVVFWIWRCGIVVIPILLLAEDLGVDAIRRRLGTKEWIRRGRGM